MSCKCETVKRYEDGWQCIRGECRRKFVPEGSVKEVHHGKAKIAITCQDSNTGENVTIIADKIEVEMTTEYS